MILGAGMPVRRVNQTKWNQQPTSVTAGANHKHQHLDLDHTSKSPSRDMFHLDDEELVRLVLKKSLRRTHEDFPIVTLFRLTPPEEITALLAFVLYQVVSSPLNNLDHDSISRIRVNTHLVILYHRIVPYR